MKLRSIVGIFAAAALCCSMVGVAGCASDAQTQSDAQEVETVTIDAMPIQIDEVGFSIGADDAVNYAFTMTNPNDGYIADRITLSISGYDADGTMVLGAAESVERMFPGIEYAMAGTTFLAGTTDIERLEVTPSMDQVGWIETEVSSNTIESLFSVVDPRSGRLSDDTVVASGRVVANNADTLAALEGVSSDAISAKVCAILVDTNGNIIAGGTADGLEFTEEEGIVHGAESMGSDAETAERAEQESSDGEVLRAATFSISMEGAPGFKECRYFVMPV